MAKWLSYLNGGCAEHLAKSGTLTLPKRKLTPLLRLRCPSRRVVSVTFRRRASKAKINGYYIATLRRTVLDMIPLIGSPV